MILTRSEVIRIVESHTIDDETPIEDIVSLAKSHEKLREYSIKLIKFLEQNSDKYSIEIIKQLTPN